MTAAPPLRRRSLRRAQRPSLRIVGVSALILDLRANPGGLLTQGVEVSDLFLDPNLLIWEDER